MHRYVQCSTQHFMERIHLLKRSGGVILGLILLLCLPVMPLWAQSSTETPTPTMTPTYELTYTPTYTPTDTQDYTPTYTPTYEPTVDGTIEATLDATIEETPMETMYPTLDTTMTVTAEGTADETVEATPEVNPETTAEVTYTATYAPTYTPTYTATYVPAYTPTVIATTAPMEVDVNASDGLLLQGSYYAVAAYELPAEGAPAVLLMHMNNSNRDSWKPVIQPLVDAGYNVLTVDLRGFGRTGGSRDWDLAREDVLTWMSWLRMQPDVDPALVSVMGASIGSNLALVGCGDDPDCVTAIALSPGLNYFGVEPSDALETTLANRPALIVVAQDDRESASGIGDMLAAADGEIGLRVFTGRSHGTNLFVIYEDRIIPLIIHWLDEHNAAKLESLIVN